MIPDTTWPDALVFDFDGVIADTEPLHLRAFQDVLAGLGLTLDQEHYLERYLGLTDREGFEAVARDQGRPLPAGAVDALIARKTVRLKALVAGAPVVYPGVAALVREWARHIPVAIASGALRAEIELILETEGLRGCFAAIVSADDPVASKPSPEPYQLAMRQLTERARRPGPIDPARCVAVEDSRWGIAAARAAGMRIVGVASSYAATELADADVVIAATGDLSPQVVSAALRADPRGDRRS